ncbi:hypothetical protein DSECCO2_566360 [anaerobic digester metagenome]
MRYHARSASFQGSQLIQSRISAAWPRVRDRLAASAWIRGGTAASPSALRTSWSASSASPSASSRAWTHSSAAGSPILSRAAFAVPQRDGSESSRMSELTAGEPISASAMTTSHRISSSASARRSTRGPTAVFPISPRVRAALHRASLSGDRRMSMRGPTAAPPYSATSSHASLAMRYRIAPGSSRGSHPSSLRSRAADRPVSLSGASRAPTRKGIAVSPISRRA